MRVRPLFFLPRQGSTSVRCCTRIVSSVALGKTHIFVCGRLGSKLSILCRYQSYLTLQSTAPLNLVQQCNLCERDCAYKSTLSTVLKLQKIFAATEIFAAAVVRAALSSPFSPLFSVGWASDANARGFGEQPGVKAQILNTIHSIRTVMRSEYDDDDDDFWCCSQMQRFDPRASFSFCLPPTWHPEHSLRHALLATFFVREKMGALFLMRGLLRKAAQQYIIYVLPSACCCERFIESGRKSSPSLSSRNNLCPSPRFARFTRVRAKTSSMRCE